MTTTIELCNPVENLHFKICIYFDGDKSNPSMCILLNVQEIEKDFRISFFILIRFSNCNIKQLR